MHPPYTLAWAVPSPPCAQRQAHTDIPWPGLVETCLAVMMRAALLHVVMPLPVPSSGDDTLTTTCLALVDGMDREAQVVVYQQTG
jgi:hypothetical protein